jgi:pimeloyl-ACP methyl ester carboxylesterase
MYPILLQFSYKVIPRTAIITLFTLLVLLGYIRTGLAEGQPPMQLPAGFVSDTVKVNGAVIRYVKGGKGPAIVLLHGWPQDWSEFKGIMPNLAKNFTVVALDLRGIGGSVAESGGFESTTLAEDVHGVASQLSLTNVYVVGHNLGGMVAYAYARLYPKEVRGVMIMESGLPGVSPWEKVTGNPGLWHINFHQTPRIPEILISGRQEPYFREIFNAGAKDPSTITNADVRRYASAYRSDSQLRAALEIYRAFPASSKFNTSQTAPTETPVILVGGEEAYGPLLPAFAQSLQKLGWKNVSVKVIPNSRHYLLDEKPNEIEELIETQAAAR